MNISTSNSSNLSTLFSSLSSSLTGSSSIIGSFSFTDYASIKSGSYGKLLKAYYSELNSSDSDSTTSSTKKTSSSSTLTDTSATSMKKKADSLKTAAESLSDEDLWKQTDGEYDMDKIASAVTTFANKYNDVVTQSSNTKSTAVKQDTTYMTNMTTAMTKALSKVGVTVGTDGKLSVDEDTLKKADGSSLKTLFSGSSSYGNQIAEKASSISKDAITSSSLYSSSGSLTSVLSSTYSSWI